MAEQAAVDQQLAVRRERIEALGQEINACRKNSADEAQAIRNQVEALEVEHSSLRRTLAHLRLGADAGDLALLQNEVYRWEEQRRQIENQLDRLRGNDFIASSEQRCYQLRRRAELEEQLKQKTADHEGLVSGRAAAEQVRVGAEQSLKQLEARMQEMQKEREKLQLDAEAQAGEVSRVEQELRFLRERLPPESQEALEAALAAIVTGQMATFARMDRPAAHAMPTQGDMLTVGSMAGVLARLEKEREDLRQHIAKLQAELVKETTAARETQVAGQKDLTEARRKAKQLLSDREKWSRLVSVDLQNIKDLQRKIAKQEHFAPRLGEQGSDAASSAGFSDLSDLDGLENALDIVVVEGEVQPALVRRLEAVASTQPGAIGADQVRTIVCLDLGGFDSGFSAVATGLQPRYDSLVSFGPFVVNDSILKLLLEGSLAVELRGSLPSDVGHQLLGKGTLVLDSLLRPVGYADRWSPLLASVVTLSDPADLDVPVARVRLKLRLRYPMNELVEDYRRRVGVEQIEARRALSRQRAGMGLDVAPYGGLAAFSGRRTLGLRVHRIFGLRTARPHQLLCPYVFYQVPRHPPYFTRTGRGPECVFDDVGTVEVIVDTEFCEMIASSGGLHFIVFDDAADENAQGSDVGALGLLGELKVSLRPLLQDSKARVEGAFALKRSTSDPDSATVGYLEVSIWWQDMGMSLVAMSAPMTDTELKAIGARLIRNLRANGVVEVEAAFDGLGSSPDAILRQQDFVAAVEQMKLGLSLDECARLFNRFAGKRAGRVSLRDLRAEVRAFAASDTIQQLSWMSDCLGLIMDGINRKRNLSIDAVYQQLLHERGGLGGGIDRPRFGALVRAFREDLSEVHLDNLWFMLDKDRTGALDFLKFKAFLDGDLLPQEPTVTAAAAAATSQPLSKEHVHVIVSRLLERFRAAKFQTLEQIVAHCDADKDGKVSTRDLDQLLSVEAPNLSIYERRQVVAHFDKDRNGIITVTELQRGFEVAEQARSAMLNQVQDAYARVRDAISRHHLNHAKLFRSFCKVDGLLLRKDFENLIRNVAPEVSLHNVTLLWHFADKNSDGALSLDEFSKHFLRLPT